MMPRRPDDQLSRPTGSLGFTRTGHSWSRAVPCLVSLLILAGCPRERPGGAYPSSSSAGTAGPRPSPASALTGSSPARPDKRRSGPSGEKGARAPAGSARRVRPPPWLRFAAEHDLVRLRKIRVARADAASLRARLGKRVRLRKIRFYEAVMNDRIVAVAGRSVQGGHHAPIHFAVYLDHEGKVARVQVIEQHEVRGASVAEERFLSQYVGKAAHDPIRVGADVDAVTGATISSEAVTRGVRKAVVLWDHFYRL